MRPIRVLHILPNFGTGGAERLVVDLMEAMDKGLFEVAAISLFPESRSMLEEEIRERKLNVFFLNKRLGPDPSITIPLYRLIRDYKPHVVHTHRYVLRYSLLPTLFNRVPGRVHTMHNVAQKEVDAVGKWVHKLAFTFCQVVPVSISEEVATTVKALYGSDLYTPIVYNGITTARFSTGGPASKRGERLVLIHVGRFAPQKNHDLLIQGFALALARHPYLELWLVGDGHLRPHIQSLVQELSLQKHVRFLGLRKDIPELMKQADVFLLPSDWEGVPLVVLEAMAAGKPVVATSVGGVPELVKDEKTGILISPGDPETLAGAILRLARDSDLRRRMGEAAHKWALERFDVQKTAQAYGELYLKLLRRRGRK
ncbi:glycosyltransferase [Oceanithermus desulfurans]|nr:glycosyltransferase [Oceanithermus desulfurans]MBB6030465.1 glycosyltransferase involved in cell wall biosynthesis [Oceanithermus desulfurans]